MALILTLTACSGALTASETTKAVFAALEPTLPTAAKGDAERTKREVGAHRIVFFELCEELNAGCQQ